MKMKKLLAVTLATSMVMTSALSVSATTATSSGSSETTTVKTYAEEHTQSAGAAITVGGVAIKTSVAGVYAAESVQGIAVKADLASVKSSLGLTGSQTPKVIIYDTDVKKSNLAMNCVNAAIEALGGADLVSNMYIDLSATEKGKTVTLTSGSVGMVAGLPKGADTGKTYSVICVQPKGVVTILEDQDTDPKTVTFAVQAGIGTYAIVGK